MLVFIKASIGDAEMLTGISNISKQFWNYTDEEMSLWKEDLAISDEYITKHQVYKVYISNILIGFYALKFDNIQNCYELDHLWLLPEYINKGFGKEIFKNIIYQLANLNQSNFFLIAEPHAVGFYNKMNGKKIRTIDSKISGRTLDVFEFYIN